jgi:hypothetical protein
MKRILVRAGKASTEYSSVLTTLDQNNIGNNSGNLLFAHAVQRHLSVPGTEVVPDRYNPSAKDADRINAEFTSVVLPLANAFRKSFLPQLARYTELIIRLRIPVTVIGVGAQASLDAGLDELAPHADVVKAFVRAVLDRSAVIGVRGAFTADYLQSLGFKNVEVIGCPSMYLRGKAFKVEKRVDKLTPESRIAVNITQEVPGMNEMALANYRRYPDMVYVPQDMDTLLSMVWGEHTPPDGNDLYSLGHPFFRDDKAKFFLDPPTWLKWMRERDFTFGSRIHGNMVALQSGTPACLIAHDSRTRELAEVLCIPYVRADQVNENTDIGELYDNLDLAHTNREYPRLLDNYMRFLDKNCVEHALRDPALSRDFDERVENAVLAPPVTAQDRFDPELMTNRVQMLRTKHSKELDGLKKKLATTNEQLTAAQARIAEMEGRLAALETALVARSAPARV